MSEIKKYEILFDEKNSTEFLTTKVYRIKALVDIKIDDKFIVKKGDIGGYVENEYNLSHDGNSWIFDDAIVCNHAHLDGNAIIFDEAVMHGYSSASGSARISGACLCGNVHLENEYIWFPLQISNNKDLERVLNFQEKELNNNIHSSELKSKIRKEEDCKECNNKTNEAKNKEKSK